MGKYLKLFNVHTEYESFTGTSAFIKPNISVCLDAPEEVHFNPKRCEETIVYEVIGTPSYPSTIEGDATSFNISFNYRRTDIDTACTETITEGSDSVTVECGANPSTSSTRTVSGTVTWNGNEIEYSVTQSKFEAKVMAKFNVTSTTEPTRIASATTKFSGIEIDGIKQPSVTTGYTFSTTGEHTVKYTLTDPTSIGSSAFTACNGLTSIVIPDSVTSIGSSAFYACSGLTSITIPSGVTSIGTYAFSGCSTITSIDIPNSVTSIGGGVFNRCSSLTSCTIGSGVTSISSSAFQQCDALTSITIPDSITSIGGQAFAWCYGITSITIPSGVTSIGDRAFYICKNLRSITCNAMTAPTIQSDTFQSIKTGGTLTVPSGSSGYDVWMGTGNYYLGKYNWTKVEQ